MRQSAIGLPGRAAYTVLRLVWTNVLLSKCKENLIQRVVAFVTFSVFHSIKSGESEVEQIAERIEARLDNRVRITFGARVRFLHDCRRIARERGYNAAKISKADLQEYRDSVDQEVSRRLYRLVLCRIGFYIDSSCLLELLNTAVESMMDDVTETWFHYNDFNLLTTKIHSRWPWMRTEMRAAIVVTFLYYLFTPILFCNIIPESNICEAHGENNYLGWVSSLYFASTTISTGKVLTRKNPCSIL